MYYCAMPVCSNCQSSLVGDYCSNCGQRNLELEKPIWSLLGSVISETFDVDGRAAVTLKTLFRHPGMLTAEFLAGRRVAYSPPLRLYLIFSIIFFLVIAWLASSGLLREPGADLVFDAAVQARFLSDDLPPLMFLLLPVFAALMKVAYWQRLYFDHLIFALHLHCVAYVALAIMLPLEAIAAQHIVLLLMQLIALVSFLAHFIFAVHYVYRGSWVADAVRSLLVLLMYGVVVSIAIELASEFTIITD